MSVPELRETESPALTSEISGRASWLLALPPVVLHVGTLALVDPARHLGLFLLFSVLGSVWLAVLVSVKRLRGWEPSVALVLGVAALLRLLLIPLPANLSDDVLRYVWDGRVVAAGENPYRHAPESPTLSHLRDDLWDRLPHRDVATVYPPLALSVFSIAARLPFPVVSLKIILSLVDLLTCFLLVRLSSHLGLTRRRMLFYAWNPLVTMEVAGMGHVDSLGVLAVVLVVSLLCRPQSRPLFVALAASAGILAKVVPVVALPLWARGSSHFWRFLSVVVAVVGMASIGVLWVTGAIPEGLVRYGVSWDFNGPIFEPLWRLLDRFEVADGVKNLLDRGKDWSGGQDSWNRVYPYVYPQLLAKCLLAIALLGVVLRSFWDRSATAPATGRLFAGALLCTATFYPWYALWVMPWAALCLQPAWLALGALLPLTYLAQPGPLELWPGLWALVWLPFFLLWIRYPKWSTD